MATITRLLLHNYDNNYQTHCQRNKKQAGALRFLEGPAGELKREITGTGVGVTWMAAFLAKTTPPRQNF